MYFNQSNQIDLTPYQQSYLSKLRKQLITLEHLGKSGSSEWWSIAESITELEQNI